MAPTIGGRGYGSVPPESEKMILARYRARYRGTGMRGGGHSNSRIRPFVKLEVAVGLLSLNQAWA